MPGFDGTGPMGAGPLTGGGRGFCAAYPAMRYGPPLTRAPYYGPPAYGPLYGRPFGRGRGFGWRFLPGPGRGRGYGRGFGRRGFYPGWGY